MSIHNKVEENLSQQEFFIMRNLWLPLSIMFYLTGCATQGVNTVKYDKPDIIKVENEITVNKPFTKVWDGLVKELSKSFYIINNIDKESRIINVSFSTNKPPEFIDCGKTYRTYTQGDKVETFNYDTAGSSRTKIAHATQPHQSWAYYSIIDRNTNLEGRSNIYIAPSEKDNNITVISVNTRNIWTVKLSGSAFAEHVNGNVVSNGPTTDLNNSEDSISFNTNGVGTNKADITCISNGKLEKEILGMVTKL